VCKSCNDKLGSSVDVALTDHFAIQGFRRKFRLAGKTGRVPVPFSRGGVLVERGVRTSFTWDGEYMHRRPTERVTANGRELLLDPRDAKDIPKIEAALRARGRSDRRPQHSTTMMTRDVNEEIVLIVWGEKP
jgi:hypothetical protein